jgi:hypothetical protein
LVNQESRAVTDCFRTAKKGALAMESGLRPAATQLENRQRRFGPRLRSLPQRSQAKEVVVAASGLGKTVETALGYSRRMETTTLLEDPEAFDAETIQEAEATAKSEAERSRPGLTVFIDEKRRGEQRWKSWALWSRNRCFSPRPRSRHLQKG